MPRNSQGQYTLPAGNPVITGTTITTSWANPTMTDIGTEIQNSLDRNGRGSMLAPLKSVDGSVSAPGYTFGQEISTGLYRESAGRISVTTLGVKRFEFSDVDVESLFPLLSTAFVPTGSTVPANGMYLPAANVVGIAANSVERLRLDPNGGSLTGRFLIGAGTDDGGRLTISGSAGYAGTGISVFETSSGGSRRLRLSQDASQVTYNATFGSGGNAHVFQVGGTDSLIVNSNGVGIGTLTTPFRLNVAIGAGAIYSARYLNTSTATSDYNVVLFEQGVGSGAATGYFGTGGSAVGNPAFRGTFVVGTQSSSPLVFNTNDTERMRIDAVGNVQQLTGTFTIGTGAAAANNALVVNGGTSGATGGGSLNVQNGGTYSVAIGNRSALIGGGYSFDPWVMGNGSLSLAVSAARIARLDGNGLGIFTDTPSLGLDVASGFVWCGPRTAAPGSSGNVRLRDDTSTFRWLAGILGSAGAVNYSIFDAVGGAERLAITPAGDTTITNSGNGLLTLTSSAAAFSTRIDMFSSAAGSSTIAASQVLSLVTNGAQRVLLDASGNVTPNVNNTQAFGSSALRWSTVFATTVDATTFQRVSTGNLTIASPGASGQILLSTNGATRVTVTAAGVVQPAADGTQALGTTALHWSNVLALGLQRNSAGDLAISSSNAAGTISLNTAGSQRLSVTAGGNIFPGADQTQTLGGGALRWLSVQARNFVFNDAAQAMLIGHVGLNAVNIQTNSVVRMEIRSGGDVYFPTTFTTAAAANAVWDAAAGQLIRSTSSRRYKTDIRDLPVEKLGLIDNLRPIMYKSTSDRDDNDLDWFGLIAEEVAEVEPRLAAYKEIDGVSVPDGVQYDRLTVLLIAEVKQLKSRITELENSRTIH